MLSAFLASQYCGEIFSTCLNVSLTIDSPLDLRMLSYSRRMRGSCVLFVMCPSRRPRTAPSSSEELAPWARYGSMGWQASPLLYHISTVRMSSSLPSGYIGRTYMKTRLEASLTHRSISPSEFVSFRSVIEVFHLRCMSFHLSTVVTYSKNRFKLSDLVSKHSLVWIFP